MCVWAAVRQCIVYDTSAPLSSHLCSLSLFYTAHFSVSFCIDMKDMWSVSKLNSCLPKDSKTPRASWSAGWPENLLCIQKKHVFTTAGPSLAFPLKLLFVSCNIHFSELLLLLIYCKYTMVWDGQLEDRTFIFLGQKEWQDVLVIMDFIWHYFEEDQTKMDTCKRSAFMRLTSDPLPL